MLKFFKIILLVMLISLVFMGFFADRPEISAVFHVVNFSFYVRVISILGMIVAVLLAWGFKRRIDTSQKYRRADQMIAEAKATAERHVRNAKLVEDKLKADYEQKSKALSDQLAELKDEHQDRLKILKAQNIELKDEVSKLMRLLKKNHGTGL